jgi:hypothetical protein
VPYLVAIAALRGLTAALPIFHASDERVYHLPLIHRFAAQLPFPDIGNYRAAQTPLFHLLLAYAGKVIGYQVWRLRLVEVVISYLAALALYLLLIRRRRLEQRTALALSLLFALSPYVYGSSFRVLTDNLALLLVILSLERLERFRESGALGPFAVGAASAAAAVLTRQSMAFMFGVAALYALVTPRVSPRASPIGTAARAIPILALAAAPVAALFAVWHGLVPPGGDPASCGLCPAVAGKGQTAQGHLVVQSSELALATIGLYGAVLFAPQALSALRRGRTPALTKSQTIAPVAAAAAGILLLLLFAARPGVQDAGYLWRIASHLPTLDGSSLLFWALVPLGSLTVYLRLHHRPANVAALIFFACFLSSTLVYRLALQKYVDPLALLGLLLTVRRADFPTRRSLLGAAALALGFIAYTLSFVL